MGTSTSVVKFLGKVNQLPQIAEKSGKVAVATNRVRAVDNARQSVKSATNGSSRLRNAGNLVRAGDRVVGRKGAALTVTSKLQQGGDKALISAVGPWQLIESDTKQHFIGPAGQKKTATGSRSGRNSTKARLGRAKAVRAGDGIYRFVYVSGTKGKHPWRRAFDKTTREAPAALQQAARVELNKVFR